MQCGDFRELADSYLSDELSVETNHEVIAHLEACAECRRELTARRELRAALRAAFADAEELRIRDQFAQQLPAKLRANTMLVTRSVTRRRTGMAIAACLLLVTAVGAIAIRQRQRSQTPSEAATAERKPNIAGVKSSEEPSRHANGSLITGIIPEKLSQLAAGDHRDCAIGHRLPERPIDLDKAGREYDRAYLNLARTVMAHRHEFKEPIDLVAAHWCVFNGQSFAHIVLRHRGRLASLLVTRLERADHLATQGTQINPDNQVIACSKAGGYQISCFRTPDHAVFVVSDLEETDNLALARKLAPPVYEHITSGEEIT